MMTGEEIIKLVQDSIAGKKILRKLKNSSESCWNNNCNSAFNFAEYEYKAKPIPLVCFVNEYPTDIGSGHRSAEIAMASAGPYAIRIAVKMVEVEADD